MGVLDLLALVTCICPNKVQEVNKLPGNIRLVVLTTCKGLMCATISPFFKPTSQPKGNMAFINTNMLNTICPVTYSWSLEHAYPIQSQRLVTGFKHKADTNEASVYLTVLGNVLQGTENTSSSAYKWLTIYLQSSDNNNNIIIILLPDLLIPTANNFAKSSLSKCSRYHI